MKQEKPKHEKPKKKRKSYLIKNKKNGKQLQMTIAKVEEAIMKTEEEFQLQVLILQNCKN